jgi:hypothetical protein
MLVLQDQPQPLPTQALLELLLQQLLLVQQERQQMQEAQAHL